MANDEIDFTNIGDAALSPLTSRGGDFGVKQRAQFGVIAEPAKYTGHVMVRLSAAMTGTVWQHNGTAWCWMSLAVDGSSVLQLPLGGIAPDPDWDGSPRAFSWAGDVVVTMLCDGNEGSLRTEAHSCLQIDPGTLPAKSCGVQATHELTFNDYEITFIP